jgi:hypothetical protein
VSLSPPALPRPSPRTVPSPTRPWGDAQPGTPQYDRLPLCGGCQFDCVRKNYSDEAARHSCEVACWPCKP